MTDGAWAGYKYFDFAGDEKEIKVTVRGTASGELRVTTRRGGKPVATVKILPSEGWRDFVGKLSLPIGVSALYFGYEGSGAIDMKEFTIS